MLLTKLIAFLYPNILYENDVLKLLEWEWDKMSYHLEIIYDFRLAQFLDVAVAHARTFGVFDLERTDVPF